MSADESYEGVTHAGILLVRLDGEPTVFLAQRSMDETDDPAVQETWEMPGGSLEPGEDPLVAALREFEEEIGFPAPEHEVLHGWRAGPEENYQGFLAEAKAFPGADAFSPTEEVQDVGWFTVEETRTLNLRPEFAEIDLTELIKTAVSGNEDMMDETTDEEFTEVDETEPEFDSLDFAVGPIPVHGVIAPEEAESGDGRAFSEGAMTTRPLRIPFRNQKSDIGGHDGAVTVGSVDRIMRKDGLIHWEGLLMNTEEAAELIDVIEFFGRYGVSVDGDRGSLDTARTKETEVVWFDRIRAAGLTAVAIPAFAEAYVALGPHPDFPDEDPDVMTAGACSPDLLAFKRGPGWVTNPKETSRLHRYWTQKGQPGYKKIAWGTRGDWTRAKALIGAKIAANSPDKMRFLNQIISQWHFDALGYWPGQLDMPGNKTRAEARADRAAKAGIEFDDDGTGWEAVLTSSAKVKANPPLSYFHRHADSGPLVIEDPDENGVQRVHGYAAEWGVCHVGMSGQCVEPPRTWSDDYRDFHLGRTKTDEGFLPTGVLTYGVGHRSAKQILAESADQAFFDNVNNAWASVRLGEDERGIWFSGVVLPGIPEDHLVKIAASGQVSGEWLQGELRACLTVNVPGFPVERPTVEYDDSGNVMALAASAFGSGDAPCDPTPAERMHALRVVDAEERFARLKAKWEGSDHGVQL